MSMLFNKIDQGVYPTSMLVSGVGSDRNDQNYIDRNELIRIIQVAFFLFEM